MKKFLNDPKQYVPEMLEGIALANDSPFGLAGAIRTNDITRAHRVAARLKCGIVWINDHHRLDPASPDLTLALPEGADGVGLARNLDPEGAEHGQERAGRGRPELLAHVHVFGLHPVRPGQLAEFVGQGH